jgi:hypothetical protein
MEGKVKPIKVFVYQEAREPKEGEWYLTNGNTYATKGEGYTIGARDIYRLYETEVPEWATKIYPLFVDNCISPFTITTKDGRHSVGNSIPLPQPEKRCRWRGNYIGGSVITEEKYTEEEMTKSFYGNWQPIEDDK